MKKVDTREASENLNQYFKEHLNWRDDSVGRKVDRSDASWQFSILLILFILFVIIRIGYINRLRQLLEAIFSIRYMRQVIREELALSHPFSLFLLFNFSVCFGFLIFFLLRYFAIHPFGISGFILFGGIALFILVLLFIKTTLLDLLLFAIGTDGGQNENRYTFLMFYQVTGIVLLPVCILAAFGPEYLHFYTIIFGLLLIGLVYITRLVRGVVIGIDSGSAVMYIFLYLCALELAPLIVGIKLLMREIG